MSRTKLQDIPSEENVITDPKQVVVKPLFAKPSVLSEIFGISYSSTRRILIEWEKDHKGINDLYYSLSSTMIVISIPRFEEYMKARHKKWM
ncbi:TPA: helix-turn-helix domain-containing protein [Staphylococcus aureus]|uniref:helix-turn-helix domain-containing protein n=1 Tax=Staphylococcus aureus TaxID=1280 RepID=UPI001B9B3791|nr:helix-turn-helix domain-containing protein [Staphylococcus aureus]HBH9964846.1 helix-turn-helix domain-containing protein [Staphylococcus aureus]HBH9996333.1 helix-turn-helix domain-containing protein [Staphylococcus aureus]HBI0034347.1 helix-turn-helix domain-containing protein [Staphylococcus aureus]HBI0038432.1 helix-turn-helix domain-containing protein [Staphylococcus aureus]